MIVNFKKEIILYVNLDLEIYCKTCEKIIKHFLQNSNF